MKRFILAFGTECYSLRHAFNPTWLARAQVVLLAQGNQSHSASKKLHEMLNEQWEHAAPSPNCLDHRRHNYNDKLSDKFNRQSITACSSRVSS